MTYEELLGKAGGYGRFQKLTIAFMCLVTCPVSLQVLSGVFLFAVPEFRCAIPGLPNDTYTVTSSEHARLLNTSVPWDVKEGRYSQCKRYTLDSTGDNATDGEVEKCDSWVYSTDIFTSTLVTELSLVCDRQYVMTVSNSLSMAGLMVGCVMSGFAADRFGRRWTILVMLFFHVLGGYAMAGVSTVAMVYLIKFLETGLGAGYSAVCFTWMVEVVTPDRRVLAGSQSGFGWGFGMLILAFLAYFFRDWQTLQLVCASLTPAMLVAMWFIPESPRWLMCKGRHSEAFRILKRIASANGRHLPENAFLQMTSEGSPDGAVDTGEGASQPSVNLFTLFRSKVMALRLAVLGLNWIACTMVYYGLTLNVGSIIEGDLHLNFFILCLLELLAYLLVMLLLDVLGRKKLYVGSALLAGLACLSTMGPLLAETSMTWINTILANLGKFGVTCSFSVIWIFTVELIPTSVRSTGLGFCSFAGRIGAIVSPYIADLRLFVDDSIGEALPLIVFGSVAILAGLCSLLLPETAKTRLPQTLQQAKSIHRAKEDPKALEPMGKTKELLIAT